MFKDIGKQIKNWAKANFVIGNIVSLLPGIIFFLGNEDEDITWVGFLIMFGGTITISAFSTLLYGFGELIDKVCDNESHTKEILSIMKSKEQEQEEKQTTQITKNVTTTVFAKPAEQLTNKNEGNADESPVSAIIRDGEKVCPK